MSTLGRRYAVVAVTAIAIALPGCASYVEREEFNSTAAELRAADQNLQSQIQALSQKHDMLATEMASRVRVDTGAHFATGDATLREEDKPFLADFANVIGSHHPNALVTVEGFADPQGSTANNLRLGQSRADAVAEFLLSSGMSASQVRAVSYGEAINRQVRPGAIGEEGVENRRVSLAIDRAGTASPTTEQWTPPSDEAMPPTEPSPADGSDGHRAGVRGGTSHRCFHRPGVGSRGEFDHEPGRPITDAWIGRTIALTCRLRPGIRNRALIEPPSGDGQRSLPPDGCCRAGHAHTGAAER